MRDAAATVDTLMRRRNASKASGDAWAKSRCAWGTPVRSEAAVWSLNAHWAARLWCRGPREVGVPCTRKCCASGVFAKRPSCSVRRPAATNA